MPLGVEGDQEQIGALSLSQQVFAVLATGQRGAKAGVEAIGDGGLDQKRPQIGTDTGEDLVGEIVKDEALAATEGINDRGSIGPVRQRDGRELQTRNPALGARNESLDKLRLEPEARPVEIGERFSVGVSQLVGTQLDKLAMGPEAGERQGRVFSRQQDEVSERRSALDQDTDEATDWLGADRLVVVEDEHERVIARRDLGEKRRRHEVRTWVRPRTEQTQRRVARPWPHLSQCRNEVANEPGEIVVGRIER